MSHESKTAEPGSSLWTTPAAEWTFEPRDLDDPNVTAEDVARAMSEADEDHEPFTVEATVDVLRARVA